MHERVVDPDPHDDFPCECPAHHDFVKFKNCNATNWRDVERSAFDVLTVSLPLYPTVPLGSPVTRSHQERKVKFTANSFEL